MHIKAILTDVGGVLVKTVDASKRTLWEEKLQLSHGQLAKEVWNDEARGATVGLTSADQLWQTIREKFSLTDKELIQLKKDFFAGDQLNNELFDYLSNMKQSYTIAILSNAWNNARNVYTNRYHLNSLVDYMFISAEEKLRKPDPQFYYLALERLHIKPQETIFIDDAPENIFAAYQIGINAILFTDTKTTIEKIETFTHQ